MISNLGSITLLFGNFSKQHFFFTKIYKSHSTSPQNNGFQSLETLNTSTFPDFSPLGYVWSLKIPYSPWFQTASFFFFNSFLVYCKLVRETHLTWHRLNQRCANWDMYGYEARGTRMTMRLADRTPERVTLEIPCWDLEGTHATSHCPLTPY